MENVSNYGWKQSKKQACFRLLKDLKNYIHENVFTGKVQTFEEFEQAFETYRNQVNPQGSLAYQEQISFLWPS